MEQQREIQGVTKEQLREAEEGLIRLLFVKRFSREWIERHVPEVMAQARADLAIRFTTEHVNDVVALLVVIAYRRALKVLRSKTTGPTLVSIEEVFHLADESAKTPEEEAVDHERQARLLKAISHLPEREQKLLALVYFGELTVKDAGKRLGWSPSSAVRHQREALEKLRALVGDRSLLGADIAVPAFIASNYTLPRGGFGSIGAAAGSVRESLAIAVQRFLPLAETGNAMAMSGAGRTTAGVCGLAVAACLTAVTSGVVGPGVGTVDRGSRPAKEEPPKRTLAVPEEKRLFPSPARDSYGSAVSEIARPDSVPHAQRSGIAKPKAPAKRAAPGHPQAMAPEGSARVTTSEFSVEGAELERTTEPTPSSIGSAPPVSPAAPASAPSPAPSSPPAGGGSSEFGM